MGNLSSENMDAQSSLGGPVRRCFRQRNVSVYDVGLSPPQKRSAGGLGINSAGIPQGGTGRTYNPFHDFEG